MTQTENHVWPYKVSREDQALEFVSFQYEENLPGMSARVRLGDEQTHVTTPKNATAEERDEFVDAIREHFRTRDIDGAFQTVDEASRLSGWKRAFPAASEFDESYISGDNKLSLLKWELGAHRLPRSPGTEAELLEIQRERLTRDCGDLFEEFTYSEQRSLLRIVDIARTVFEKEADALDLLESEPLSQRAFHELVSNVEVALYDYELLSDDLFEGYEASNPLVEKQIKRVLQTALDQLEDGLALIKSYAPSADRSSQEDRSLLISPEMLGEKSLKPEEFLPQLPEEHREVFERLRSEAGIEAPMEVFPKRFSDSYTQACKYLALHPVGGPAGMELLAQSGKAGEEFLTNLWGKLSGLKGAEAEAQREIARVLGRFGREESIAFLNQESEIRPQEYRRSNARRIAAVRKEAAFEGLEAAGERASSAFPHLAERYRAESTRAEIGLVKALISINGEGALDLFREHLHENVRFAQSEQLEAVLNHFRDNGKPDDLGLLFSVHTLSEEKEKLLKQTRSAIIRREPSWFKRLGHYVDQYMNGRISSMARDAFE